MMRLCAWELPSPGDTWPPPAETTSSPAAPRVRPPAPALRSEETEVSRLCQGNCPGSTTEAQCDVTLLRDAGKARGCSAANFQQPTAEAQGNKCGKDAAEPATNDDPFLIYCGNQEGFFEMAGQGRAGNKLQ
ncbi:UNVERIFIED_CONTAM: hypothetical protein K2H54_049356 [Gekko kuhli]